MRIAVHLNESHRPSDFFADGRICIFEGINSDWIVKQEFPLKIMPHLTLHEMKQVFISELEKIRECKDFIVHEKRGIFRVFLEDLGFRVWDSSMGQLADQLDEIAGLQACTPDSCEPTLYPEPVGEISEGLYRVNLIELMTQGVPLVSREILIPFLETTSFSRLEVICDHAPRWFDPELSALGVRIEKDERLPGSNDRRIVLVPHEGDRTCPKGRTRRSCGCNCGG